MAKKKTTLGAAIAEDIEEWVSELERTTGKNRSWVVREALNYYRASSGPKLAKLESDVSKLRMELLRLRVEAKKSN